jgi:hypothetical protein
VSPELPLNAAAVIAREIPPFVIRSTAIAASPSLPSLPTGKAIAPVLGGAAFTNEIGKASAGVDITLPSMIPNDDKISARMKAP